MVFVYPRMGLTKLSVNAMRPFWMAPISESWEGYPGRKGMDTCTSHWLRRDSRRCGVGCGICTRYQYTVDGKCIVKSKNGKNKQSPLEFSLKCVYRWQLCPCTKKCANSNHALRHPLF